MSYAGDCTRVYAPAGQVAHLLPPLASPNYGYPAALCWRRPRLLASWLGTGSQGEHEKASSLPLCTQCEAVAQKAEGQAVTGRG